MTISDQLLRAILATVARQTFSLNDIAKIVSPTAGGEKQILAYNLCDGKSTQAEIGKKAGIDQGNLSRSLSRWIEAGIIFRIGDQGCPMHVFPIPEAPKKRGTQKDTSE